MRKVQFAPGSVCHIYNRGVEGRDIFLSDGDRWRFLQGLMLFNDEETKANLLFRLERDKKALNFNVIREYLSQQKEKRSPLVKIMTDCLKPNHYHLILEEVLVGGISRFMHKLGGGYTKFFNTKYNRSGHLFQGPFQAVRVDNEDYLRYLIAYINVINPAQEIEPRIKELGVENIEKVTEFTGDYPWSTNLEFLGKRESCIIDKGLAGQLFSSPEDYEKFIRAVLLNKNKLNSIKDLFLE